MEGSRLDLEKPIEDAISRIRFAPESSNLLISSWDSVLRLYDVDESVMRLEAHSEGALLDCCFRDELTALSAGSDGCVRRFDLCSNTQTFVGKHDDSAIYVEYSEQTGQVITAGLDKKLIFWDIQMKNGDIGSIKTTESEVWSISISGLYLLASIGKKIDIYDLRNLKKPVQSKDFSKKYQIWRVCSFHSCQGYAVGSVDGCVDLKYFDPAKDSEMGYAFWCHPKSKDRSSHLVAVNDIKFHPRNESFVTGDNEGHAIIWNAESRKRLFELGKYPNSVASLAFDQAGQFLAVASSHTYQEANEREEVPQIFIHKFDNLAIPGSSGMKFLFHHKLPLGRIDETWEVSEEVRKHGSSVPPTKEVIWWLGAEFAQGRYSLQMSRTSSSANDNGGILGPPVDDRVANSQRCW